MEERGRLPKYGDCWQGAIEHVHEGCRYLSEETQSDIALHITNCFLQMSGHEQYNCELDKKPNLRGICINSMSDRAFNVYTEFYTHVQNICWFLRGQVWQEKIMENSVHVGKQLKNSMSQQELLLNQQEKSLEIQERLLTYGVSLERILNESRLQATQVVEEIRLSTIKHQELLTIMAESLGGLKSWLIGEISWFDSIVFYVTSGFIILILTSTKRTASSRLPLLLILSFNIITERTICDRLNTNSLTNAPVVHESVQNLIWYTRRATILISTAVFFLLIYKYRDYAEINNGLLLKIQQQNYLIKNALEKREENGRALRECSESLTDVSEISKNNSLILPRRPNSRLRYTPDIHRTYNLRNRTPNKYIPKDNDLNVNNNNNSPV